MSAIRHAAPAIAISAGTVILGLAGLASAPARESAGMGLGGMIVAGVSALAALTLLPALVLAAGRYLSASNEQVKIPLGLGARHAAAASITAETKCIAIVVSQTSGAVRLFKDGNIVLELHQTARRT